MTFAHLHLILTHFPIVGMILSFFLIVYALWRKDQRALDIALVGILFSGVFVLPVFWSGEGAEDTVEHLPGVMESAIDRHGDAAVTAAVLAVIAAGAAFITLLMRRRHMGLAGWGQRTVVLTGLLAILAMGWTANLGGQIRRPEITGGLALLDLGSEARQGSHMLKAGEGRDAGKALKDGERDDDDDDGHGKKRGGKHDDD